MATAPADTDFVTTGKKPGDRIQCVVVTPERTLFDEVVESVVLPLLDGELGVLPGRAPLLGRLGYGELRTGTGAGARRYYVDGGFAQVRDDVVTVLTGRAIPAAQVDIAMAQTELERARARIIHGTVEAADRIRQMERAHAMLRVARHALG